MRRRALSSLPRRYAAILVALCALGSMPAPVAAEESFDAWRARLRAEALQKGVSAPTFDNAIKGVAPIPDVIEKDQTSPNSP